MSASRSLDADTWAQLAPYLDQALDTEPAARAAWLEALARREPAVTPLLRGLLDELATLDKDGFLEQPLTIAQGAPGRAGQQIGSYTLRSLLGRGGMGEVWLAERTDGRFEGKAAVKLLDAALVTSREVERFRREGLALGRLSHPHIARLLDAGVLEERRPYLVLEHVVGSRINRYCEERRLDARARVLLLLDVVDAVVHAHTNLVVHRDLKPSNVMVTAEGAVKLLDFGIAKLLQPEAEPPRAPELTRVDEAPFTPEYAAPEQLLGEPVSTATDVYQLGVLLFVLLARRHPFEGLSTRALRIEQLRSGIVPRPDAGGDLDAIVARCLRVSAAERYANAQMLADDLRRYLAHQPVLARQGDLTYRARKFVRRHRVPVFAGGVAALALSAAAVLSLLALEEARLQRDAAMFEARSRRAQNELSALLIGDLLAETSADTVRRRLERARDLVRRQFGPEPVIAARLLVGLSGRYVDLGDYKAVEALMQEAEAIARRVDDPRLNAEIACHRAEDAAVIGDTTTARSHVEVAQANLARLEHVPESTAFTCMLSAAQLERVEGDFEGAAALLRQAITAMRASGDVRSSRYTSTTHELGSVLVAAGQFGEAWRTQSELLRLVKELGRANTAGFFANLTIAASALQGGGRPLASLRLLDDTLQSARATAPEVEVPFAVAGSRANAEVLATGGSAGALAALKASAAAAAEQGSTRLMITFRTNYVRAAAAAGAIAEAKAEWANIAPLLPERLRKADRSRETVAMLLASATLDLAAGAHEAAGTTLDRAEELIAARGQTRNAQSRDVAFLRAAAALAAGDGEAAARDSARALELAREFAIDPQSSAWVGEALTLQARAHELGGNPAAARASAREALKHLQVHLLPSHHTIGVAQRLAAEEMM